MEGSALPVESSCLSKLDASIFANQLNRLSRMSKNLTIDADLSQVLDDFLQKLNECDKYLANGIFNTNFAEAALLLQSSADIYGKKVDMLWDIIIDYQKRIVLYDKKSGEKDDEIEKLEERKRKYKRKRKANSDETQTGKLVSSFSFGAAEPCDYLNQAHDPTDLLEEWEWHSVTRIDLNPQHRAYHSKTCLFLPEDILHTVDDNEYIGRYDQFHSASLVEEMFSLEDNDLLEDEHSCLTRLRIDSYVVNDFLQEKCIPSGRPVDTYVNELNVYISNFIESRRARIKNSHVSYSALKQLCRKEAQVHLQRLPLEIIKKQLRRISTADSMFDSTWDDDAMSIHSNHSLNGCSDTQPSTSVALELCTDTNPLPPPPCADVDPESDSRTETVDDSALSQELTDSANVPDKSVSLPALPEPCEVKKDNVGCGDQPEEVRCEQIRNVETRTKSCSQDSAFYDCEDLDESTNTLAIPATPTFRSPITRSQLCCGSSTVVPRLAKLKSFIAELNFKEETIKKEQPPRKKRISIKTLKKLSTGTTVDLRPFERFYCAEYRSAEDEGQPQKPAFSDSEESQSEGSEDEEEENDNDNFMGNTDVVQDEDEDLEEAPELHPNEDLGVNETNAPVSSDENFQYLSQLSDYHCMLLNETTACGPSRAIEPPELTDEDLKRQEISRANVREWRAFICPKLKSMQNRSDFDIHEYGSQIIAPVKLGETLEFKKVVAGKTSAEVARFFIATLQLANANNVEISGAIPGQLANDTFKIKVVDKTKYHELLEEYQAPSEETFQERLEQVKAMNPKVPMHSTPFQPSPPKKLKLTVSGVSKKKLF